MARKTSKSDGPTREQAQQIDLVAPLLKAITAEVRELSKKKQDGILSPLKVTSINRLLTDVKLGLGEDPSTRYLDLLDPDDLPQNSDAVIVLTQWEAAVAQFRDRYFGWDGSSHVWFLAGGTVYEP